MRLLWVLLGVLVLLAVGVSVQDLLRSGSSGGDRVAPAASDEVVRVVDGDTVVLRAAGKSRLIGVDSPEVFGERECFGRDASAFAKRLLRPGLRVGVERDVEERDRYGRRLIYLRLPDGRSFNELLVAEGFAVPLTIPPNVRHADRIRELASRARKREAGLWSSRTCDGDPGGRAWRLNRPRLRWTARSHPRDTGLPAFRQPASVSRAWEAGRSPAVSVRRA